MMTENQGVIVESDVPPFFVGLKALWVGGAFIGVLAFYWSGLTSLPSAWVRPEYSHGYLIPFIAVYLFLNQMSDSALPIRRQFGLGLFIVIFGLIVGLLGNLANIPDIISYGFIICIGGLVLVAFGTSEGVGLLIPVAYLFFMLPLPNFVYWPISIQLQLLSSYIGVYIISLFAVPVYLDGNIIDLGVYQLQVAEACSGLRYLFPLASFSFLFAVLYRGPMWHRFLIFTSALPIAVLMNSFRIGVIGLLVDRYGIKQAEGFLHAFEGWIIFIACVGVLYAEAGLLQRLRGHAAIPIHHMLEIDFSALARRLGRFRHRPPHSIILAAGAILLAGLAWQLAPARQTVHAQRDSLGLFPVEMGGWSGTRRFLEADVERILKADDYLVADYAAGALSVDLLIAYYDSQTNGSGIHSPEVCLPTGGWEVSRWTRFQTGLRTPSGELLSVNRAIIQKGLSRQLVYYWFEQRGRALTSDYAAKAYTIIDSILRGRSDGALVRLVTPIDKTGIASADQRLLNFLPLILPKLPHYVPA